MPIHVGTVMIGNVQKLGVVVDSMFKYLAVVM